jgi:hypothetical protein
MAMAMDFTDILITATAGEVTMVTVIMHITAAGVEFTTILWHQIV